MEPPRGDLDTGSRCGFHLDGLEEPGFRTASDRYFEWQNMIDLAPGLVCRLRSGRMAAMIAIAAIKSTEKPINGPT